MIKKMLFSDRWIDRFLVSLVMVALLAGSVAVAIALIVWAPWWVVCPVALVGIAAAAATLD